MPQKSLTRNMLPQISRLDLGYYALLIEGVIIVADAIYGLVASFPEPEEESEISIRLLHSDKDLLLDVHLGLSWMMRKTKKLPVQPSESASVLRPTSNDQSARRRKVEARSEWQSWQSRVLFSGLPSTSFRARHLLPLSTPAVTATTYATPRYLYPKMSVSQVIAFTSSLCKSILPISPLYST